LKHSGIVMGRGVKALKIVPMSTEFQILLPHQLVAAAGTHTLPQH
jgi:hypothetical protein